MLRPIRSPNLWEIAHRSAVDVRFSIVPAVDFAVIRANVRVIARIHSLVQLQVYGQHFLYASTYCELFDEKNIFSRWRIVLCYTNHTETRCHLYSTFFHL